MTTDFQEKPLLLAKVGKGNLLGSKRVKEISCCFSVCFFHSLLPQPQAILSHWSQAGRHLKLCRRITIVFDQTVIPRGRSLLFPLCLTATWPWRQKPWQEVHSRFRKQDSWISSQNTKGGAEGSSWEPRSVGEIAKRIELNKVVCELLVAPWAAYE